MGSIFILNTHNLLQYSPSFILYFPVATEHIEGIPKLFFKQNCRKFSISIISSCGFINLYFLEFFKDAPRAVFICGVFLLKWSEIFFRVSAVGTYPKWDSLNLLIDSGEHFLPLLLWEIFLLVSSDKEEYFLPPALRLYP